MKYVSVLVLLIVWSFPLSALQVGDNAPDFSLMGTDGRTHKLADYRGKQAVVLAWFPKAYTSGCTIECKSLTENGHLIRKFAVQYFMVSVDPLQENIGFAHQQKADFPLLSDNNKSVAKAYGVLSPAGYAYRHTIYISKEGTILAIDKAVNPETSAQDMAKRLAQLNVAVIKK